MIKIDRIEKKYFHRAMLQNILSSTKFNSTNRQRIKNEHKILGENIIYLNFK